MQREVSEPHEAIRLRTQQLKNLHAATRLLKRALRFLAALRRLKAQESTLGLDTATVANGGVTGGASGRGGSAVADLGELAKAAQSLQVIGPRFERAFVCFFLCAGVFALLVYALCSVRCVALLFCMWLVPCVFRREFVVWVRRCTCCALCFFL